GEIGSAISGRAGEAGRTGRGYFFAAGMNITVTSPAQNPVQSLYIITCRQSLKFVHFIDPNNRC
ncbi:MAG: hypothetical protein ACU88J_10710, partial [Gammaproteobacteria bacterium]